MTTFLRLLRTRILPLCAASAALVLGLTTPLRAEVADKGPAGFTIKQTATIAAAPEVVYRKLVADVGKWWNPEHTWSGKATNLSIRDEAGGCFCEKLDGGGSVAHLTVVFAKPGEMLRLHGARGPFQGMAIAGAMTWEMKKVDAGKTRLALTYAFGGYSAGGFDQLSLAADGMLGEQFGRLASYIETGQPLRAKP